MAQAVKGFIASPSEITASDCWLKWGIPLSQFGFLRKSNSSPTARPPPRCSMIVAFASWIIPQILSIAGCAGEALPGATELAMTKARPPALSTRSISCAAISTLCVLMMATARNRFGSRFPRLRIKSFQCRIVAIPRALSANAAV